MSLFYATGQAYPAEIRPLTSLRFYAAMLIVILHSSQLFDPGILPLNHMFNSAFLGVDFFFILSGFIISHVYKSALREGKISLTDFYIRRLARIYPMHVFTLFLALLLQVYFFLFGIFPDWPESFNVKEFLLHLLLVQSWGVSEAPSFNIPSWSISAEWFAYLAFPLLIFLDAKFKVRPMTKFGFSLLLFTVSSILAERLFGLRLLELTFEGSILRIIPEFYFGMCLYEWGSKNRLRFYGNAAALLIAAAAILVVFMQLPDIAVIPLFGLLILVASEQERQQYGGFLAERNCVYLGDLSYSIYLLHAIAINLVIGLLTFFEASSNLKFMFIFLIPLICISLSTFSYQLVELRGKAAVIRYVKSFFTQKSA